MSYKNTMEFYRQVFAKPDSTSGGVSEVLEVTPDTLTETRSDVSEKPLSVRTNHEISEYESDEVGVTEKKSVAASLVSNLSSESTELRERTSEPVSAEGKKQEEVHAEKTIERSVWNAADSRSIETLRASADSLIAMTAERRLQNGISHKEAKQVSENYTQARSEISKIKNRLRKIEQGAATSATKDELKSLRSQLAGHLWQLRKEFPLQGTDFVVKETEQELGALAVKNQDWLHAQPEYEQIRKTLTMLKQGDKANGNEKNKASLRQLRGQRVDSLLKTLRERITETKTPVEILSGEAADLSARIDVLVEEGGYNNREKKTLPYVDPLIGLRGRLDALRQQVHRMYESGETQDNPHLHALAAEVADVEHRVKKLVQEHSLGGFEKTKPVSLLGLTVPAAGAVPAAVAAFRKALEIEWQPIKKAASLNTEALVQDLAKDYQQLFVKLNGISTSEPLSVRDAEHVAVLASRINQPERIKGIYTPPVPEGGVDVVPNQELSEALNKEGLPSKIVASIEATHEGVLRKMLPALTEKDIMKKDRAWATLGALGGAALLSAFLHTTGEQKDNTVTLGDTSFMPPDSMPLQTTQVVDETPDVFSTINAVPYMTKPTVLEAVWPSASDDLSFVTSNEDVEKEVQTVETRADVVEPVLYTFRGEQNSRGEVIDTVSEAALYKWQLNPSLVDKKITQTQFMATMWDILRELEANPWMEKALTEQMGVKSGDIDMVFKGVDNAINLAPFYNLISARIS